MKRVVSLTRERSKRCKDLLKRNISLFFFFFFFSPSRPNPISLPQNSKLTLLPMREGLTQEDLDTFSWHVVRLFHACGEERSDGRVRAHCLC